MCKKGFWVKSLWVKNIGEHRDRWDAGFRSPLLRYKVIPKLSLAQCFDNIFSAQVTQSPTDLQVSLELHLWFLLHHVLRRCSSATPWLHWCRNSVNWESVVRVDALMTWMTPPYGCNCNGSFTASMRVWLDAAVIWL